MSAVRACPACGKLLVRRRNNPQGKWTETEKQFAIRKHCDLACEKKAAGTYWSLDAIRELQRLKASGLTYAACAEAISGTFGLAKLSRNVVVHRLRHPFPTGGEREVEPEPDPDPLPEIRASLAASMKGPTASADRRRCDRRQATVPTA